MSEDNLYRVIKPYDSNLLHSSKSLIGGASKCYKEVKKVSPTAANFSVMHMKTNEIYDFNINNNIKQLGGGADNDNGGINASLSDLEILKNQLLSIEKRVIAIEDKLNMPNMNNMNDISPNQNNQTQQNNLQQKPNEQLMQQNMPTNPTNPNMMRQNMGQPMMGQNMGQPMKGSNMMGSNMMGSNMMGPNMIRKYTTQKPNLVSQQIGNGFANQSTKASAFYSAARDFV